MKKISKKMMMKLKKQPQSILMIEEEIVLLTYNICTVITNLAQLRNLLSASILWGLLIEVKGVEDRNRKSKSKTTQQHMTFDQRMNHPTVSLWS